MEPYIIEIKISYYQQVLLVYVIENLESNDHSNYDIYQGEKKIGSIYPKITNNGDIEWLTNDLIAKKIIEEIGRKIESHDM